MTAKIYNICCESELLSLKQVKIIEDDKNAAFVCETCIQGKDGGWVNRPAAIFKCPELHPVSGSYYFAIVISSTTAEMLGGTGHYAVTNGQSAVDTPIDGVVAKNGDVIYSRFRHDNRTSRDESVNIDGGRDYTKRSCVDQSVDKDWGQSVTLQIVEDKLLIVD